MKICEEHESCLLLFPPENKIKSRQRKTNETRILFPRPICHVKSLLFRLSQSVLRTHNILWTNLYPYYIT